jgi:protein-disulfide isomerase
MIAKLVLLGVVAIAAGASQPGVSKDGTFKEGSTSASGGWKFTYSAVARPPLAAGQRIAIPNDATHTESPGAAPVFHRFFADPATRSYYGYDVVVTPGKGAASTVRFRPLSLRGDQLPKEYGAAQFHAAAIAEFPSQTYHTGETIAVDVLKNAATGQRVVDYVQVTLEANSHAAGAGLAKTLGNPTAPVCIDLYSDFECPACKMFHDLVLPVLFRDYILTGKAYLVSHEFPLTMHRYSREAAAYATAAARLGKYQPVGDALFRDQPAWGNSGKVWDTVASALNPSEQKQVLEWAKDPEIGGQVQHDFDNAISMGLNGTPSLFVSRGDKRYPFPNPNAGNYPILKSLIEQLLK